LDHALALILGEGQFGPERWQLSRLRRYYYALKPLLPRSLVASLRRIYYGWTAQEGFPLGWPIEDRYARFQWMVMQGLLESLDQPSVTFRRLWPGDHRYAFVLTHDVETAKGQAHARFVADLDESFGFRSSFNFVPECYSLDYALLDELTERGFEVGVHGLKHDGKLFRSRAEFLGRAERINHHLRALGAAGFRAPLMLRHPEWMQELEMEYDLSFFDTDPFEPIPGGTMSIWPFTIGHFVELPYTLVQDHTLAVILGETTPDLWLRKVDFIERYHGMALVNAHPDYLREGVTLPVYTEFLKRMRERGGYWQALPREVARWWRARSEGGAGVPLGQAVLSNGGSETEALVLR
jgi:hypothetical protein